MIEGALPVFEGLASENGTEGSYDVSLDIQEINDDASLDAKWDEGQTNSGVCVAMDTLGTRSSVEVAVVCV